ncbi:FecR domain-containing protein [Achromobacter aegrifaciens]|uniref:FecR domain-containing protein n=1 Tax=Achromobacter aegrifaciens TaxID=1287736 RepID=UPI00320AF066
MPDRDRRMNPADMPDALLAEAAGWMARLRGAPRDEASLQELSRWIARSPAHAQAWARAERVLSAFGEVPEPMRAQALQRLANAGRRRLAARLLGLTAAAPVFYLAWRAAQADLQSGASPMNQTALADGTGLTLDAATKVDVRYSSELRALALRAGRIYIETAPDPATPARPFVVQTPMGTVQAIGTQFSVGLDDGGAEVRVYAGAVVLRPKDGGASRVLQAGRQARFDAAAVAADTALREPAPEWKMGILTADNMRLADWADTMARYRPGVLRCASDVADLRIYGSFSLRDTDASLALLTRTLPVRVESYTRYWVEIRGRGA